jgi:protein-tyrosine phosphatase
VTFRLLFVCTGNICRSPMAERLFQARTDRTLPVCSASAGTSGLTGWEMDAPSALVLRELGGDGVGHIAQRLSHALVAQTDLILTAETEHRTAVTRSDPSAADRAFTLREFGRLGAGLGPLPQPPTAVEMRDRVAQIAGRRRAAPPAGPALDDIGDPYGVALGLVRTCGLQIASSVDSAIDALGLRGGPAPVPGAPR